MVRRWVRISVMVLLVAVGIASGTDTPRSTPLRTANAVHSLPVTEARRGLPVDLLAVTALVYLPEWDALFTADSTGGIFVQCPAGKRFSIQPGMRLHVKGKTGPGDFAPIVEATEVEVTGTGTLPVARKVSLEHISTGTEDGQWVEVEGTVREVSTRSSLQVLQIASGWSRLNVETPDNDEASARRLIGSRVRVTGAAGPVFNQKRQVVGVNMYTPSLSQVQVLSETDPFSLPVRPLDQLRQYRPGGSFDDPVHTRGAVTAIWPGQAIFLTDGKQSVGLSTSSEVALQVGDLVDVVGFPSLGDSIHSLQDAVFRLLGRATQLSAPRAVTVGQALTGDNETELVQIKGRLVTRQWAAGRYAFLFDSLPEGKDSPSLVFSATLPAISPLPAVEALRDGSMVRVTGICLSQELEPVRHLLMPHGFQLLLRETSDLEVVASPSWWTLSHALWTLTVSLALAGGALGWVLALRKQVRRQTAMIQEQLKESATLRGAAEQANRAKSEFLANMSHEIRTPMNGP